MPTPDPAALTQALVRLDTRNPPGNEDACVEMLADLLTTAGWACRSHEFAPRRRGASDTKSGVAAFTSAAIAHADRLREGPGLSLTFALC